MIWHLSFDGTITGAEVGMNANNIQGCWSLSNPITVVRENASGCQANGGELFGGPFAFDSVGDGTPDTIPAGSITLANSNGMNSQWIITDDQGIILGLPPMPSAVDFDGAGEGVCLIWHLSYDGMITGLAVGSDANNITGCASLSNSIAVTRTSQTTGGIVINELNSNDRFEIKNTGNTSVDISSYWICDFPAYNQLSTLTIECGGDLILDPGEIVTLVSAFDISEADGELGLYLNTQYSNPGSIIDYVEWGSTGHSRSSVAVAANIWTTGDFVPAFSSTMSIEYDGTGNTSMDWSEDSYSPCMENLIENDTDELFITVFPNPTQDVLNVQFDSYNDAAGEVLIYNSTGQVILSKKVDMDVQTSLPIDIRNYQNGTYYIKVNSRNRSTIGQFIKL